jgi:hypothetical protein
MATRGGQLRSCVRSNARFSATLINDGGQKVLARLLHRYLLPLLCRWDAASSEVRHWFGVPFLVCVTALRGLEISGRSIGPSLHLWACLKRLRVKWGS